MPYNTDMVEHSLNMQQCNRISRELKSFYEDEIILVDLDSIMTGKYNPMFIDVGHLNDEGKHVKASILAKAILESMATPNPILE